MTWLVWCIVALAPGMVRLSAQEHASFVQRSSVQMQDMAAEDGPERQALNVLGGANVYLTYLTLGSVYDNVAAETYDRSTAEKLVLSVRGLVDASLQKLQDVADEEGEDEILTRLMELHKSLRREADALLAYIRSGSEKDRKAFQEERTKAWRGIADALGL